MHSGRLGLHVGWTTCASGRASLGVGALSSAKPLGRDSSPIPQLSALASLALELCSGCGSGAAAAAGSGASLKVNLSASIAAACPLSRSHATTLSLDCWRQVLLP